MLRKLLLLPPLLSLLLLSGCESEADKKRAEAVELTSQAQQALRLGKFQDALIAIDKAIALEPTANRYWLRAETHMEDLPAALADLNKGLELEPENVRLIRWKESVEEAMGKKPGKK
jgi:tetratricopeptide (TPR) repeat protein